MTITYILCSFDFKIRFNMPKIMVLFVRESYTTSMHGLTKGPKLDAF